MDDLGVPPHSRKPPCAQRTRSAHLSICLSVWLAGWLSVWLAGWLSGCLAVWLSGCLAVWLSGCLAVCLAVCLSIYFSLSLSTSLSIYLSTYISLSLSILAVSSRTCWHSALACQHSRAQHSLQCIFPGVHPSRYVYLDSDSGCFYWNRKNALE